MSRLGPEEPWFREWFDETYLDVYPHRDRAEARRAVELFLDRADPGGQGGRVLDLACGAGRHLVSLARAGFRPVGLDLSRPLLRRAAASFDGPLVRADMREVPLAAGTMDAVVQFFTSFGYFEDRAQDRKVLEEVRRVLRPGGTFLMDFLNARKVRRDLVDRDERTVDGRTVRQRRWLEGDAVIKRIEVEAAGGGEPEVYHERVRLYRPEELERMMAASGLRVEERAGGYDGRPFDEDAPRLLLTGVAA